jgi:sulfite reductase (NADPH) hemoprotein beta-component
MSTGAMSEDDQQLLKFHGTYQQDDRDLRADRRKHKLEKAYSFMIRIRVPGGVATPAQWLETDRMATQFANGTIKLTTRQAFQFHGVIKSNLKRTIKEINQCAMDTIAACGDVNRNVMCNPNPYLSEVHAEVLKVAQGISDHLTPQTRAYHEIWLDGEKIETSEEEVEPIYGKTYLPRKFKITIAVPPSNDVDIYANCLSFIAIVEDGQTRRFQRRRRRRHGLHPRQRENLSAPRRCDRFLHRGAGGRCRGKGGAGAARFRRPHRPQALALQIHRGRPRPEWILAKLNEYLGYELGPVRPFKFEDNGDRFGWVEDANGNSHLTLFVQGGRVLDTPTIRCSPACARSPRSMTATSASPPTRT